MTKAQCDENEFRLFWETCRDLWQAARDGNKREIGYCLDDIEIFQINTDKATLRKRCTDILAQFRVAKSASGQSR